MTTTSEPLGAPGLSASSSPSAGERQPPAGDANDDDPYSPGLDATLLGATVIDALGRLIGIVAILLPLATVLAARPPSLDPSALYGSDPPAGIPSARAGEPGRGDPRGLAQ
jgi:hypothetical protein